MGRHLAQRQRRLGLRRLAVGLTSLVAALLVAVPGQADPIPSITVEPTSALIDGQVITIRLAGQTPGQAWVVRQCAPAPAVRGDCGSGTGFTIDAEGNGLVLFAAQVSVNSGHGVAGAPSLKCGVGQPCSVLVQPAAQSGGFAGGLLQAIDFATADALCPTSGLTVLGVEGTSAFTQMSNAIQPELCQGDLKTTFDFIAAKGDSGSRQDFLCGLRDVALTETAGPVGEFCLLDGKVRPSIYVPVANTSLVFAYKMRDFNSGQIVEDLQLTPAMIANLMNATVSGLSGFDPSSISAAAIASLNDKHVLPRQIFVIGRADASSLNLLLTRFLINRAGDAWRGGGPNFDIQEPTEYYPAQQGIDLRSSGAAVARIVGSSDDQEAQQGWFGVMDRATAAFYGLPVASIGTTNDSGSASFVAPTDEAVSKGVDAMIDGGQGTQKANVVPRDRTAYPLPVTIYAQIPTDTSISAATAKSLTAWLTYMRDLTSLPPGYVPLTDSQKTAITDAVAKVTGAPAPSVSPTPSPTPSSGNDADATTDFATDTEDPIDAVEAPVVASETGAPVVSIFAASTEPTSGAAGFLLPILVIFGAASSISGALRLTGRNGP